MYRFDHFIVNIDTLYQSDKTFISKIKENGFLYEPNKGKGTKGFKASNIWIGDEYFEMINLLKLDGGGWKQEWVERYNKGERGLICIMLEVNNIEEIYIDLKNKGIDITKPEYLKFKWCFNMFTKKMPWMNSYVEFFEGIPLQIGFQQMKDEKSKEGIKKYMIPNCKDNKIEGINKVVVKGALTKKDRELIKKVFGERVVSEEPFAIVLSEDHIVIFEQQEKYEVEIYTECKNENYINKEIRIENIMLRT